MSEIYFSSVHEQELEKQCELDTFGLDFCENSADEIFMIFCKS